ncbi:hypothetical protein CHARACLAT_018437 [Characodon lateralis]|uniref:Uncharacterized protein n=1 Tax=Characodon lateralis TaxID=208331 RepID=A0ABU7D265_9TELE|nr:hypothetical protein [Characodon lateralis]
MVKRRGAEMKVFYDLSSVMSILFGVARPPYHHPNLEAPQLLRHQIQIFVRFVLGFNFEVRLFQGYKNWPLSPNPSIPIQNIF